ncbi:uncharacterized protein LOC111879048 [Lactuca sativa]|uniref:uncharacterized protein LOC111879048 n=1 Tax=Lactuca sativa TaxID=4236 RepID=UPI000CD82DE2|nr:uncharacterized protein LOC111879048 [Lactuca sativa]
METSIVFDPTQPAPVSVEPVSEKAKPSVFGCKIKKSSKRKNSPTKPKHQKRPKVSSSSPKEDAHDIQANFGHLNTPPADSSKVPFNVSTSHEHVHGESPHNTPSPSQKGDAGVDHSSLRPPGTHPRVSLNIALVSHTSTHSGTPAPDPKHSGAGAVSPTPDASTGLIPGKCTG